MGGKKAGVYRKVKQTYILSEEGYQGGTLVGILAQCNHAVLLKAAQNTMKSHCVLCTRKQEQTAKLKRSATVAQPTFDAAIEARIKEMVMAGVAAALEEMTAPKTEEKKDEVQDHGSRSTEN